MTRRLIIVSTLMAAICLVGASTGAWAYFTSGGGGTGAAATATTVAVTLSPGNATAGLFPGGTTSVVLSVSNPNASPLRLGSIALDTGQATSGFAVDSGHSGCALSALSFTTQTTGWTVPAKVGSTNGTLSITLPAALAMNVGAANACQDATFTVYLAAGA